MAISPFNKQFETPKMSDITSNSESIMEKISKLQENYKKVQESYNKAQDSKQKFQRKYTTIKQILEEALGLINESLHLNEQTANDVEHYAKKMENFHLEDKRVEKKYNELVLAVKSTINLIKPILAKESIFQEKKSLKNAFDSVISLQDIYIDEKIEKNNQKTEKIKEILKKIDYLNKNLVQFGEKLEQFKEEVLKPTENRDVNQLQVKLKDLKIENKKFINQYKEKNEFVFLFSNKLKDKISNYELNKTTSSGKIKAISNYLKVSSNIIISKLIDKEKKNVSRIKNLDEIIINWFNFKKLLDFHTKEIETLEVFLNIIVILQDINKKTLSIENEITKFKEEGLKNKQIGQTEKQLIHKNLCKQFSDLALTAKAFDYVEREINSLKEEFVENPFQEFLSLAQDEACCEKIKKSALDIQKKIQIENETQLNWMENEWTQIRTKFDESNNQYSLTYKLNRIGYAIYLNQCQLPKEALFNSGISFLSWKVNPEQHSWAVKSPFEPISEAEAI